MTTSGAYSHEAVPHRRPLLAHVHITRTGGSTMNHVLRSSFGGNHCPVQPWGSRWSDEPFTGEDLRLLSRLYPHLRSIAGHRVFGYVDIAGDEWDVSYFAMMRDPVKACVSRFQHKVRRGEKTLDDLEDWLNKDWTKNRHTKAISGGDDVDEAIRVIQERGIFVGLTERYDESLVLLKRLVAPDLNISYQPTNVAGDRTIADQLLADSEAVAVIEESQAADLSLLEHVRHELFPSYVADYGPGFDDALARFRESNSRGFNRWNIAKSRLKAHLVYRPALYLHRRRARRG